MIETLISKAVDLSINFLLRILVYVLRIISPIKIYPKRIEKAGSNDSGKNIWNVEIKNRLNSNLYDIFIGGISKEAFSLSMVSNSGPIGKTVEHMNLNANQLSVVARDERTGNYVWIFRIHKLTPKETLNINIKLDNKKTFYLKTLSYSSQENPIKEWDNGAVAIPFNIEKLLEELPKVK